MMYYLSTENQLGEVDESMQSGDGVSEDVFGLESEEESNFMSILLTNLQVNYEAWKAEIPPEPEEEIKEEEKEETKEEEETVETREEVEETKKEEEKENVESKEEKEV